MKGSEVLIDTLEAYRPDLIRFLRRRLGCVDAANDVVQSISERLIDTPVTMEIDNPRAYLFRAAANAAHSHTRAANARHAYEAAAAAGREQIDANDPERAFLGREALRIVQDALDDLPLLSRRMFIAFRVNGESQRDIAKRFCVSLSTVEKRLAKATAHCHRRLREHGVTGEEPSARLNHEPSTETARRS